MACPLHTDAGFGLWLHPLLRIPPSSQGTFPPRFPCLLASPPESAEAIEDKIAGYYGGYNAFISTCVQQLIPLVAVVASSQLQVPEAALLLTSHFALHSWHWLPSSLSLLLEGCSPPVVNIYHLDLNSFITV